MATQTYIENITFQGRPPGDPQPSGWSVTLGHVVEIFPGNFQTFIDPSPKTPEEAAALGFDMPAILSAANTQQETSLAAAHARITELEAEVAFLRQQETVETPDVE